MFPRKAFSTENTLNTSDSGIPGGISGSVPAFGPGHDPGVPGSSPTSGPGKEPASPSAWVSASLPVSLMNK